MRLKKYKPYVPSVIFGNVRSIANKVDELRLNCKHRYQYRETCLIGLTDTWLEDSISDSAVEIEGFHLVRWDRTKESRKVKVKELHLYISEKWCKNISIKKQLCAPDIKLLCVSIRPFYLAREISNILVCITYIPPSANNERAKQTVQDFVAGLKNEKPDALTTLMGDTKQCELQKTLGLQGFEQCVKCPTRGSATLDTSFYSNIKHAYRLEQQPALKNSDHMLFMMPVYLKKTEPVVIRKAIINETTLNQLNGCFHFTDWQLFIDDCDGDPN